MIEIEMLSIMINLNYKKITCVLEQRQAKMELTEPNMPPWRQLP